MSSSALRRRLFLTAHQWLGLASSLIVVILCATGTLLALYGPLETWINRDVQKVTPNGPPIALEVLVPKLAREAEQPYTSLTVPAEKDAALQLRQGRDVTYVNPYTGEVLGGANQAMREVYLGTMRLHRWLLLDDGIGRPITGAATVVFLVTLMVGVVLWWPKNLGQLGRSLRFSKAGTWKGRNYDLHVVLGLYAVIPLAVMAASGLYWSYRPAFQTAVYGVLDGTAAPAPRKPAPPAETSITALPYTRLIARTHEVYPYAGPIRISFPADRTQPVEVVKVHQPTPVSVPYTEKISFDARTGEVVKQTPFASKTRAEQALSLVKDVHIGTVFGGASLTLYILACLIGTSLPITGTLHWWGKIRTRRRAQSRPVPEAPAPELAGSSTR